MHLLFCMISRVAVFVGVPGFWANHFVSLLSFLSYAARQTKALYLSNEQ